MALDALGLPQPIVQNRRLLAARYATTAALAGAAEYLYLECQLPGKLAEPGLPIPFRDNRMALTPAGPGVLGSPWMVEVRVWGSVVFAVGPTLNVRIGPDTIALFVATASASFFANLLLTPGTSWKILSDALFTSHSGALNPWAIGTATLTHGLDESQSLGISGNMGAGDSITFVGAEVWLTSLLGLPQPDSVLDG